jgi:hypothetical protein
MPVLVDLHASDIDQLRPSTRASQSSPSTAQEPRITDASTATLAYGADQVANSSTLADTTGDTFTVTALSLDGTQTVTTYSGIDANGNATTIAAAASLDISVTTTPSTGATSGLL